MPGVLIIEAMAQIGCIFAFKSMNATAETKVVYFMGIDGARFRKPVLPGDQVRFELELLKRRGPVWSFKGNAFVEGVLVAEAELLATIVDK
ncbi:MAG: 3-hydroxyacyl-[acyl-carrier-protein] dehydratase FabZ, partial [Deltaproteobacteria bacterium]